jgi:tight adherence protein B
MLAVLLATFAGVVALIVGAYWLFIVRPEADSQRALQQRMQPKVAEKRSKLAIPKAALRDKQVPKIFQGLQSLIDQSGMKLTLPALFFMCWMSAFVLGAVVWQANPNNPIFAGIAAFAGLFPPYWFVKYKASARMWKFEEQFPEAIDLIARALRAGHAFPTGLSMVADEVSDPVGPEFKLLYERQNFGMSMPDALRAFANRVPILDARFFAIAVLTQRDSGGNLSGVLDNLSAVIRERFKVKREVKSKSAHGRMTAGILMLMPPAVGVAQMVVAPANIEMLFSDPLGQKMLIGAAVMQGLGMFVIQKIVNIEY